MSDSFQLRVVTPSRMLVDERVREVTAPGTEGEVGILPEHITFLGALDIGILTYRTDRGGKRIAVRGGFIEYVNDVMTVLVDDAALPESVNVEA
ncbi:MAG TPA: ATP synthase F1 subunit epsilon, partial [Terriglobales bacterium]|nr:ATP synthase F1 subunit epsilon [Terriglobales bacterium]